MKRIFSFAAAASILVMVGLLATWGIVGNNPANIAFAQVAEALHKVQGATFDVVVEKEGHPYMTAKCWFLAPSHYRVEWLADGREIITMIEDKQLGKSIDLLPDNKWAFVYETAQGKESPLGLFEIVQQLVHDGRLATGQKVESLGKKELEEHVAIGFRTFQEGQDITIWADTKTALPVRIEWNQAMFDMHAAASNFCYEVDRDPSLFSLEPPADYKITTQTSTHRTPVEADLLTNLRIVAEHNDRSFPAKIGDKQCMVAIDAYVNAEIQHAETQFGKKSPQAEKASLPAIQKAHAGIEFVGNLWPESDSHYAGGGVKLGTPDRAIFWYKPTGLEKYRVIYADLSVKEMTPEEVKNLPEATPAQ